MKITDKTEHSVQLYRDDLCEILDVPAPKVKLRYYHADTYFDPDSVLITWQSIDQGPWVFNEAVVYGYRRLVSGKQGKDKMSQKYRSFDKDWPDFVKILVERFHPSKNA